MLTCYIPEFEPPNIAGAHNPGYPSPSSTKVSSCHEFNICGTQLCYRAFCAGERRNRNYERYDPAPIPDKAMRYA